MEEVRMTIISLAFIDFLTYIVLNFGSCSTGDIESEELGLGVSWWASELWSSYLSASDLPF